MSGLSRRAGQLFAGPGEIKRRAVSGLSRRVGQLFAGPGKIKRREVSGLSRRVGQSFAGPGKIKRREVVLDPQESSEEIKSREVELSSESWTYFALVVPQQLCYGHCLCDSAPHSS